MVDDSAKLRDILESPVVAMGYELVHVELLLPGGRRVLRLYIDAAEGIGVEDCESVSRQVSLLLDVETPLPSASLSASQRALQLVAQSGYVLEVSSPGLDRPLVKPQHFKQFIGQRAKIVLNVVAGKQGTRRRFIGQLLAADAQSVRIEVAGEQHEIAYREIASARLKPVF